MSSDGESKFRVARYPVSIMISLPCHDERQIDDLPTLLIFLDADDWCDYLESLTEISATIKRMNTEVQNQVLIEWSFIEL